MTTQKAQNVSRPGSAANFIIAAKRMAMAIPSVNRMAPASASSSFGENSRTVMAAKAMAEAPLGHTVTTQKSSTAPIVTNTRVPRRQAQEANRAR